MPVPCSQTRHQNPLSGPLDHGNAGGKEGRELVSSSDWDAVLSDLLFQPFCWLTFSHWTTNSVNCGRASHTNEKQGTAALFASQKPGCLQWFQTQPSSSRASPCIGALQARRNPTEPDTLSPFRRQRAHVRELKVILLLVLGRHECVREKFYINSILTLIN